MDANRWLCVGNSRFVDGSYALAIEAYSEGIDVGSPPQDVLECLTNRAAAHIHSGNFPGGVADSNEVLSRQAGEGPTKPKLMAFLRKGECLYSQREYEAALTCFQKGADMHHQMGTGTDTPAVPWDRWIRKCNAEISGSVYPLSTSSASVNGHSVVPPRSAERPMPAAPVVKEAPAVLPKERQQPQPPPSDDAASHKIRHEWMQTSSHVMVTVYAKGLTDKQCNATFADRSFSLTLQLPGEGEVCPWVLRVGELHGDIVPDMSTVVVSPLKVELKMKKKTYGAVWPTLEKAAENKKGEARQYPSSRAQKKDWEQIDKELEDELKAERPEGEAALNALFREIYAKGDEDTRRAMVKSFQTSGGTVLSTNWGEVSHKDYEKEPLEPPAGQERKQWNE
ncbi:unnamed protein product [Vitrella brassicaformis CCMP3155]|uniref:CS domain-containing protein n=1 Tax=Vitrella brassicaformis (strain CCMP3155) TaxID=1169540 RepID=A0A0G4FFW8_VITBC|nr:unnamed protein product [Vitrella brassicaformis CCMP3155]|eukprot:CEM12117.1 unnamed protein product [Vitrella brassicaformis CCMP3155]